MPRNAPNDIRRIVFAHAALNMGLETNIEFLRAKSVLARPLDSLVEIAKSGKVKQMLRDIVLDPRSGAKRVGRFAGEVALLGAWEFCTTGQP